MMLTDSQTRAVEVTERINACISVLSSLFIILTYSLHPAFNKAISRLVFWTSFSILFMSVAPLISASGMGAGKSSVLCMSQAFFVQMFLGVDAMWSLCMATNVYLSIFKGWSTKDLAKLDFPYLVICYGASGIPAIIYLILTTSGRATIYGPALIWCWIDIEYDYLRIVTLYAFVWFSFTVAACIYGAAGAVIWKKREHLQGFLNPFNESFCMTEVAITYEDRKPSVARFSAIKDDDFLSNANQDPEYQEYSVGIETQPRKEPPPDLLRIPTVTRIVAENEMNSDAWLYARTAVLYYFALLVVWVPSSINRIYSLVHPSAVNFGLNYASAFVFSIQGFLILIVYVVTSQTACKCLWQDLHRSITRQNGAADESTQNAGVGNDRYARRTFRRTSQRLEDDATSTTAIAIGSHQPFTDR
ncbi:hypothetical protein MMC13_006506 [Lambiella insularis]|nr:hypothetical protein [Lambiella insularis]